MDLNYQTGKPHMLTTSHRLSIEKQQGKRKYKSDGGMMVGEFVCVATCVMPTCVMPICLMSTFVMPICVVNQIWKPENAGFVPCVRCQPFIRWAKKLATSTCDGSGAAWLEGRTGMQISVDEHVW